MQMDEALSRKLRVLGLIAIVLVVYLHSYNLYVAPEAGAEHPYRTVDLFVQSLISRNISSIAVPLFFSISGFLFFMKMERPASRRWFLAQLQKRIRTVLAPYLLWSLLSLAGFFLRDHAYLVVPALAPKRAPDTYSLLALLDQAFVHPIPYQLWFLRDLMIYVLLSPLIYLCLSRLRALGLAPLLALWFADVNLHVINCWGILFFCAGAFIALDPGRKPRFPDIRSQALLLAGWLALVVLNAYWHAVGTGSSSVLNKISVLVGLAALWVNYETLLQRTERWILPLASFTFFIYAAHEPILSILKRRLMTMGGGSEAARLLTYLMLPLITIALVVCVGYGLRACFPRAYRVMTGGR